MSSVDTGSRWPVAARASKVESLSELAARVSSGDVVGVGGGLSSREPMALLRELIRAEVSDLTVVGSAHGIDIDLLCGAGAVARTGESYVGFEQDFGMAPNYRRSCEDGTVKLEDSCCYTLVQQLRAAIQGLPFMPIRSIMGTSFEELHPEYKAVECPFTGDTVVLVPALRPDVAVLHVQYADEMGNLRIEGPEVADVLFAKASKTVLATAEKIVSTEELHAMGGISVPYFYVTAVAEVSFGAHPTACYPFYAYDRAHTQKYYKLAKAGEATFRDEYLQPYVLDCASNDDYLERVGGDENFAKLASWKQGKEEWMALYQ
uniref:3-oxoadipate CoA-transferase subunit A n=1 Tax=Haliea sp. ETY-M TaxID=1055105 RepID=A0A455R3M6_9GAMM|nr:3-oxoadipate CoA-transferase subunit A [Haliea sp. ETY-M]